MVFVPSLTESEIHASLGLPRFSSLAALSAGGQGVVFRAVADSRHPHLPAGEVSAFKVFAAGSQRERAEREVNALRSISCDSLVRVVDHGVIQLRGQDCIYLETEFIDGEPLDRRLQLGPLRPIDVAQIVEDVALAIDAMWSAQIVHRDIKPANIMLRPNGRAVVIDLGVARHTDRTSLTPINQTLGTMGYLSPEQARTVRSLSCKSDVFALGIVAQEGLLGRHPTNRDQSRLLQGLSGTAALAPGAPPQFWRTIDAMLVARAHTRPLPRAIVADMRTAIQLLQSNP